MVAIASGYPDRSKDEKLVRELTNQYCPYHYMNANTFMWRLGLRHGLDRLKASGTNPSYLEGHKVGLSN